MDQLKASDSDHSSDFSENEDLAIIGTKGKAEKKKAMMPSQFYKAKRTLTRYVTQYFSELKQEFSEKGGTFSLNPSAFTSIQAQVSKYISLRYTPYEKIIINNQKQKFNDTVLSYFPESQKIFRFTPKITNPKINTTFISLKYSKEIVLPDIATPVSFKQNIYLLNGAIFHKSKNIFIPMKQTLKLNIATEKLTILESLRFIPRIKSCIVKNQEGIYIIGGYAEEEKILTKKCEFFSVKQGKIQEMPKLNKPHSCPSGCFHNGKIYIFSKRGIQFFCKIKNEWIQVQTPKRFYSRAFQFCISVNSEEILIFGGKENNKNSTNISLYNTQKSVIDNYYEQLPVGLCSERSWGPIIGLGHVLGMSTIQASMYPQVTHKSNMVQLTFIGPNGCFLHNITENSNPK